MPPYANEKQGQIEFYEKLQGNDGTIPSFDDFTDGVVRGTILEFKLKIDNINATLSQTIKYLSRKRVNGKDIPSQILLVSLNEEKAYLFKSNDFLKEIETQYVGSASINNNLFNTDIKPKEINYHTNFIEITNILKNDDCIKVHIDLYCVVGYANRFYNENPKATKINFFEELRNPQTLKNIIYKWEGKEEDFQYIMDCLNDNQHKKELGAFYTPKEYVKLSTKLVREAIKKIKQTGNDYIILDRCAGTGNLELFLTDKNVDDITIAELDNYLDEETRTKYLQDKKDVITLINKNIHLITMEELEKYKTSMSIYDYLFDNEISHCIVNTYELKEWVVLNRLIGDKVKMIIPPVENINKHEDLVHGGDALSEYFITGIDSLDAKQNEENDKRYSNCIKELNEYVKNENINIIMLENPPYRDDTTGDKSGNMPRSYEASYVKNQMRGEVKGVVLNDVSNRFIWSAQQYYLKKENDFFILYSPVKYFKSCNLCNKTFIDGFILNRLYFHASSPSAISLIMWQNRCKKQEEFNLKIYDILNINGKNTLRYISNITIKKVYRVISEFKDKRTFANDSVNALLGNSSGYEIPRKHKMNFMPIYNDNIIGYMISDRFTINYQSIGNITRLGQDAHAGFYLRSDNYISKLPLFCAKLYPQENWYERDVYFTTADGGFKYMEDTDLLKSCLIYTCLCRQNKCISFNGSDGRFYKNELCFCQNTIADNDLKTFTLNNDEEELFKIWHELMAEARKTKEYNSNFTYGLYQIDMELNICYKYDKNGNKIYSNNENYSKIKADIEHEYTGLNTKIILLKGKLKEYYKNYIQDKLFKYELLK